MKKRFLWPKPRGNLTQSLASKKNEQYLKLKAQIERRHTQKKTTVYIFFLFLQFE
jgi:hypothetical protein